jgi:hypothetical protein
MDHTIAHRPPKTIPSHLIFRGSQTTHDHELGYHDSCILYKG